MRTVEPRSGETGSQIRRERIWTAERLAPERAARRGEAQDEPNNSPSPSRYLLPIGTMADANRRVAQR